MVYSGQGMPSITRSLEGPDGSEGDDESLQQGGKEDWSLEKKEM